MANIVGIDLGTTFSAVATLDETGRPAIVHNSEGVNITPSVVSFVGQGVVEIGEGARRVLGTDPKTVGRFKRDMGTAKTFTVGEQELSPTSLSGMVLRKLKEDFEKAVGPIDAAVVTIPANFANEAREATLEAARLAGLEIRHIVNEPTAAALYYAFKSGGELAGTYAVYDLGGGTFDISIIRVSGQDVEVMATDGVSRLGGDDFDLALQQLVQRKYADATGAELLPEDFTKNDAEEEKKSLSRRGKSLVRVSGLGGRQNLEVTRAEFEEVISPLISQAEMLCEGVLLEAGVGVNELRGVFLVGGSTRTPMVAASVERVFQQEPTATANVDEVVALGAALYAAFKADREVLSPIQRKAVDKIAVAEITAKCFGTLILTNDTARGGLKQANSVLIERGTRIPCSVTEIFTTIEDNQIQVSCEVTESTSLETDPRFVKVVCEGLLDLPPGRPSGQEISVTFSYDENQVMKCSFVDVGTGAEHVVDLSMAQASTSDLSEIEKFTVE